MKAASHRDSLETERCIAHLLSPVDRADIARLYASVEAREFLGGAVDGTAFGGRFDKFLAATSEYHWSVRLKDGGDFLGLVSLSPHHDGEDTEVSYQFMPSVWGKGYASEMVCVVIEHAFLQLKLPRMVAETQAANEKSRRLLERVGMIPVKTIVRFDTEQIIYGTDNPEFPPSCD